MFPWEVFHFSLSSWLLHVNLIACNDGIFEKTDSCLTFYIPSKKHLLRHFCHCFSLLTKGRNRLYSLKWAVQGVLLKEVILLSFVGGVLSPMTIWCCGHSFLLVMALISFGHYLISCGGETLQLCERLEKDIFNKCAWSSQYFRAVVLKTKKIQAWMGIQTMTFALPV